MPEASTPDSCAGAVIVTVGRLVRRIREVAADDELSLSQRSALSRLVKEGDATASHLATIERVRPQSMAATVGVLLDAGLVASFEDPHDGRRRILAATDAGRALVRGRRTAKRDWLAETLAEHCTAGELRTLTDAMGILDRVAQA